MSLARWTALACIVSSNLVLASDDVHSTRRRIMFLETCIETSHQDHGSYPSQDQWLAACGSEQAARQILGDYDRRMLFDLWDRPFEYRPSDAGTPTIFSRGPDGLLNTPAEVYGVLGG